MEENKQMICGMLASTLARTRQFNDLFAIVYNEEKEIAECYFINGGCRKVNVAADSGAAMIRDILRALE